MKLQVQMHKAKMFSFAEICCLPFILDSYSSASDEPCIDVMAEGLTVRLRPKMLTLLQDHLAEELTFKTDLVGRSPHRLLKHWKHFEVFYVRFKSNVSECRPCGRQPSTDKLSTAFNLTLCSQSVRVRTYVTHPLSACVIKNYSIWKTTVI